MDKQKVKSHEELDLECEIIEQHLKWEGVPTFVYLSALSALIWALVEQENVMLEKYGWLFILSSLIARIAWKLFNGDIFAYRRPDESDARFLTIFTENIKMANGFDLFLHGASLSLLFNYGISGFKYLWIYLATMLIYETAIFYFFRFSKFKLKEEHFALVKHLPGPYHSTISLVFPGVSLMSIVLEASFILLISNEKIDLNLASFKITILLVGAILLTRFYIRGTYFLTAIAAKKSEKLNALKKTSA